jgi:opacity protein-like surface antigen
MLRTRLWIAVLSALLMLAASAAAQDEKNEVGGSIGRIFISNQGPKADPGTIIAFGKGISFEGEYARRFWVTPIYAISAEGLFVYNPDEDINGGSYTNNIVPYQLKAFFITPAARVNLFPTTAVSPWVSFGAGFGHISEAKTLIYGGTNPGKSTTSAVIQAGVGLDVKVWKKMSIRGQARDFWSGEPDFPLANTGKTRMHNYYVSVGAFWRF